MTIAELRQMVAEGESLHLELKRKIAHPEKVVREIVAFANTKGGTLLVGVEDNLAIPGLSNPDEDEYLLDKAIAELCSPAIAYKRKRIPIGGERTVLVYTIPEGLEKPYYVADAPEPKAYFRVADKSIQASRELRQVLKQGKREKEYKFGFGDKEKVLFAALERQRKVTVNDFMTLADVDRRHASRTLVLLCLVGILRIEPGEREDYFCMDRTRDLPSYQPKL